MNRIPFLVARELFAPFVTRGMEVSTLLPFDIPFHDFYPYV